MNLMRSAKSLIKFRRKTEPSAANRRFMRHECCVVATMTLVDRHIELEGLVLEVSRGGILFRNASTYVMSRTGEDVTLAMLGRTLHGSIVASRATGYGLKLFQELDPDFVAEIAERYPINAMQATAAARAS